MKRGQQMVQMDEEEIENKVMKNAPMKWSGAHQSKVLDLMKKHHMEIPKQEDTDFIRVTYLLRSNKDRKNKKQKEHERLMKAFG
jgi:hypothetical protein